MHRKKTIIFENSFSFSQNTLFVIVLYVCTVKRIGRKSNQGLMIDVILQEEASVKS